jgi:hypothetical protein
VKNLLVSIAAWAVSAAVAYWAYTMDPLEADTDDEEFWDVFHTESW